MLYFGADYYPEHWPEERWQEDARLMAEAGFNVVRLAEFAWSKLEPKEGCYDFAWLDRAIDILAKRGIEIILGTPTASPPPWLMTRHPEIFLTRQDGRPVTYGNRRNYSPNSAVYRDYTRRIVTRMAEHYKDHPAVIGWQIDNEFGDRDYNAEAFRTWLQERFGTLEAINARWGTTFWSHVYTDWEQIPVPLSTGGQPNPGLALDFHRFCSESYVDYQKLQLDILREVCPKHFITHNLMGFAYELINYFDLARELDFVSWDNYPRGFWDIRAEVEPSRMALAHDTMRGLKGKNFWVMEQQAGAGGWDIVSVMPKPGELRLWAYQAIAHGADGIVFFRWRTARHGTEQYWHGLLEHDGRPGRRYEEIKRMGSELREVGERLAGATTKAEVAMMLSYDSRFAFQIQPNNPRLSYAEQFLGLYKTLFNRHIAVDVVPPEADLSRYKLVIAPSLYVLTEETAKNLERFVEGGGVLLVTPRTGVKDEANAVVDRPLPGLLVQLCGIVVEDYDSLPDGVTRALEFEPSGTQGAHGRAWCDILAPDGAEVVARYADDHYAGKPALTMNRFGQGRALYLGTVGDDALYELLAKLLLELAGVASGLETSPGLEVCKRWQGDRRLVFVLNHAAEARTVKLDRAYRVLFNGSDSSDRAEGFVALAPREVLVLEAESDGS
jgi:beta-galactosidase